MTTSAICIIPARGGSKRVPRKNIRLLGGLPLIAHSIRNALDSNCFDRIVVSTDDQDIAGIAREHGAEIPFLRGEKLSDDHATTAEVILDAVERTGSTEHEFTCCLYPTAPLLHPNDLKESFAKLRQSDADSMLAVTDFDYPPLRALKRNANGTVSFNWPQHALTRSQDLPELIHDAGLFYWVRTAVFLKTQEILTPNTICHEMERLRAVDIDTEQDFAIAEQIYAFLQKSGTGRS